MRAFFIAAVLLLSIGLEIRAQDQCPQPRVMIANDVSYRDQRPIEEDILLNLVNTTANSIIALNRNDIAFSSLAYPGVDVDYTLSLRHDTTGAGAFVLIKIVDNNQRLVLNFQSRTYEALSLENLNSTARAIAEEISPLIQKIRDHQHQVRNTTMAAISSTFEPEQRSYALQVNQQKRIPFVLKDCDGAILPGRTILLELEGGGEIDRTSCTVDENGRGEFVYRAPDKNETARVTLVHRYEDVAGNDNRIYVDAISINTSGKLWLLVNHVSKGAEIYMVGEHIGALETDWNSENTRGGSIAAFSDDPDEELWSFSLVGFIEMTVKAAGEDAWAVSNSWFPGPAKIWSRQQGGYTIEILWPLENGTSMPVRGTITYEKPAGFDQARNKYLAAKRGR